MAREKRIKLALFSETLLRLRKDRGGDSAHAFFRGSGGHRKLGITYHYYLLLEQGVRLPSPRVLGALIAALGLNAPAHHAQRKSLLTAFVRSLCGGDPLFNPVFEEEMPVQVRAEELFEAVALKRLRQIPRMSEEQYETANSTPSTLWAFEWLLQTGMSRTLSELCGDLGYPPAELQFSLDLLVARKLIQRAKSGKYSCKRFATDLFGPTSGMSAGRASWVSEQVTRKSDPTGAPFYYPHFFLAIEELSRLGPAIDAFNEAIRKVYLLRPSTPLKSGRLVAVECRISPLAVSKPKGR